MFKKLLVLIAIVFIPGSLISQNVKLGHINLQELVNGMPENDSAKLKLEKIVKDFQKYLEEMQTELNRKYLEYSSKKGTWSESMIQLKENELQDINNRIQQFQASAHDEIETQRGAIFKPVFDKATKTIAEVAKENSFTYIFDISGGSVIYQSENSINILPLVRKKMGLK